MVLGIVIPSLRCKCSGPALPLLLLMLLLLWLLLMLRLWLLLLPALAFCFLLWLLESSHPLNSVPIGTL